MNPAVTLLKSRIQQTGGLEKYTWRIAEAFCLKECPVTLLTTGPVQAPFQHPLLKIISFPICAPMSYLHVRRFDIACKEWLQQHPTSIVFGLDRNRFQTHVRAGNGAHAAFLRHRAETEGRLKALSFLYNPLHRLLLDIEKKSFENPALKTLFTNSHLVKQEILSFYQTPPEKIRVIHNGVEWSQMSHPFEHWQEKRQGMLKYWQLDPKSYQLLFIGNNFRRKGLEPLIRALKGMPIQLSIVGKDKYQHYFQQLVSNLHLEHSIRFFGEQKDTWPFYQMADALAIPSLYDPFANVTVEALAMGLYVISSTSNGGHEVLRPFSGTTFQIQDSQSLKKSLEMALGHPKTPSSSQAIRASVAYLDFPKKLSELVDDCLYRS